MLQSYFRPLTAYAGKEAGRIYDFEDHQHDTLREHARQRQRFASEQLGQRCVYSN
jgi:hypothetical protein